MPWRLELTSLKQPQQNWKRNTSGKTWRYVISFSFYVWLQLCPHPIITKGRTVNHWLCNTLHCHSPIYRHLVSYVTGYLKQVTFTPLFIKTRSVTSLATQSRSHLLPLFIKTRSVTPVATQSRSYLLPCLSRPGRLHHWLPKSGIYSPYLWGPGQLHQWLPKRKQGFFRLFPGFHMEEDMHEFISLSFAFLQMMIILGVVIAVIIIIIIGE